MSNRPGQGAPAKASTIRERLRRAGRSPVLDKQVRLPKPPAHLDDTALHEWHRLSRRLKAAGLLADLDWTALAALCVAFSRWCFAEEQIKKTGLVYKVGTQIQPNPFLTISRQERDTMMRILAEFGMSPASRSRLPAAAEKHVPRGKPEQTLRPGDDPRKMLQVIK